VNKDRTIPTRILVTAGPTIEPLDPVRFISNHSTGIMGYEIAKEALKRGLEVCLVTGPVHLAPPIGAEVVGVTTAREMKDRVLERVGEYDCVIMAAAVCDFRAREEKKEKIKKKDGLTLELVKNPDILEKIGVRKGLVKVGFALETEENWLANAKEKMRTKNLDLIIANVKKGAADPFGPGEKNFVLVDKTGGTKELKNVSKDECASLILDEVARLAQ
jgi:phosphopantothenoylcysteine decarboxylase/phosphopantothenate--cysteine ligase